MRRSWFASCLMFVLCVLPISSVVTSAASTGPARGEKAVTLDTDPNLAGWWKFDDASGKSAIDSSRHGRNGRLEGGMSFEEASAEGRTGKALKFEGGADCVVIAKYKGVTGTRPRTVAAWVKTKNAGGKIASWGTDEPGQMWMFCLFGPNAGVTPKGGYLYMKEVVNDGRWHHVAVVVRQAVLPNLHDDVKLYRDGEPAEIHDIGLLDLWPIETGDELDVSIGGGFKGLLDDVRIYDRALSGNEIRALFKLESNLAMPKS